MFKGTLKIRFFIDIVRNVYCSGLFNSGKLLIFKFGNFKFDLQDNFANNFKKLEFLQIFTFLGFKMI